MKVLTFGELLLRLSAPGYNKLFQTNEFDWSFCGGEANVAVSLSNFGVDASFVTKLPNNDVGVAAKRSLDYFGVNTNHIVYGEGRMGLYYLEKGASQRPSKIIYDRSYSCLALASPTEFDWDKLFDSVDWFHFTGISPALSQNVSDIVLEACKIAKKKGIIISCDLNYRKQLWSNELAQKTMSQLMKYVDVCIANEEDAQMSLGIKIKSRVDDAKLDLDGYVEAAKIIEKEYGCSYVAFTLRESYSANLNGWSAILYNNGKTFKSKRYEIQIVDRVGGGDSFAAGLIYGLINKIDMDLTINFATAASCLKQTIEGDFNRCSVKDVYALIDGNGSGRVQR